MNSVINWRLLSHPLNWAIVWSVFFLLIVTAIAVRRHLPGGCGCKGSPASPD